MANSIQINSKESPRFDGRTLKWFYHNTFPYTMIIELTDSETGQPVEIGVNDKILVRFYDRRGNVVHEFEFANLQYIDTDADGITKEVEITLDFNEEVTSKFAVGKYTYCTTYYGEYVTTIWDNAEAEVEECH